MKGMINCLKSGPHVKNSEAFLVMIDDHNRSVETMMTFFVWFLCSNETFHYWINWWPSHIVSSKCSANNGTALNDLCMMRLSKSVVDSRIRDHNRVDESYNTTTKLWTWNESTGHKLHRLNELGNHVTTEICKRQACVLLNMRHWLYRPIGYMKSKI